MTFMLVVYVLYSGGYTERHVLHDGLSYEECKQDKAHLLERYGSTGYYRLECETDT